MSKFKLSQMVNKGSLCVYIFQVESAITVFCTDAQALLFYFRSALKEA